MEETSAIIKSVEWEVIFFLRAFFLGFCMRMGYDIFLILRRLIRHRQVWVALEDFCFWGMGSVLMFGLLFRENNGTPRGFVIIGVLLGMCLYHFGPSPILLRIVDEIKKISKKMSKIITKKVTYLLQKIKKQSKINNKGNSCLQEAAVERLYEE